MRHLLIFALATAVFACSEPASKPGSGDTGSAPDTATRGDSGEPPADSATPADTAPADTAAPTDTEADSAAPEDSASPPDTTLPEDTAVETDTADTAAPPESAPWLVLDGVIYHQGAPAQIRGVNWFGMETSDHAPHGLWSGRTVADFVAQVSELGFNALRLPLSPGSIRPGFETSGWAQTAGYATGREALEAVLIETQKIGLWVLLDYHSCNDDHGTEQVPTPDGCPGATLQQWHEDLQTLAELGLTYDNVLGIDLFNEPYGLTWANWSAMAAEAAAAVLATNPNLLIFVQGVANESDNAGYKAFWGGNMVEATIAPPDIPADRLVYSPHVYGPSVTDMPYFSADDYPLNLPKIWQAHFAHLHAAGFAVITGEFGSRYNETSVPGSVAWQDAWITFMVQTGQTDFFYWALNANTGAITGILENDWLTPDADIMSALAPLLE